MHVFGAFELDISPGTSDDPACARMALGTREANDRAVVRHREMLVP